MIWQRRRGCHHLKSDMGQCCKTGAKCIPNNEFNPPFDLSPLPPYSIIRNQSRPTSSASFNHQVESQHTAALNTSVILVWGLYPPRKFVSQTLASPSSFPSSDKLPALPAIWSGVICEDSADLTSLLKTTVEMARPIFPSRTPTCVTAPIISSCNQPYIPMHAFGAETMSQ